MRRSVVLLSYWITKFIFVSPVFALETKPAEGCVLEVADQGTGVVYKGVPSIGCLAQIVVSVINFAFVFLGAAAIIYLLFGAIKFVISRGDQKALQSARNTMTYAVIGVVFILLSYAIIAAISKALGLDLLSNFTLYQK